MKDLDENNLDTAIALGDAVCNELGLCCEKRGRVIFQILQRLEEMKPEPKTLEKLETNEASVNEHNAHRR